MWGDLYDPCGTKNQGFHNGRNFEGYFLVGHTVLRFISVLNIQKRALQPYGLCLALVQVMGSVELMKPMLTRSLHATIICEQVFHLFEGVDRI